MFSTLDSHQQGNAYDSKNDNDRVTILRQQYQLQHAWHNCCCFSSKHCLTHTHTAVRKTFIHMCSQRNFLLFLLHHIHRQALNVSLGAFLNFPNARRGGVLITNNVADDDEDDDNDYLSLWVNVYRLSESVLLSSICFKLHYKLFQ